MINFAVFNSFKHLKASLNKGIHLVHEVGQKLEDCIVIQGLFTLGWKKFYALALMFSRADNGTISITVVRKVQRMKRKKLFFRRYLTFREMKKKTS